LLMPGHCVSAVTGVGIISLEGVWICAPVPEAG
jgi:hypothetical protein